MADQTNDLEAYFQDKFDEGVNEQGDSIYDNSNCDEVLSPLQQVQKYGLSFKACDRKTVIRIVPKFFRISPPEVLAEDLPQIMQIITSLGEKDETSVRIDLLQQIPKLATKSVEYSDRLTSLPNIIGEYLLPLVVRCLGCIDKDVDDAAYLALLHLLKRRLITQQQVEIQVCPTILALAKDETSEDLIEVCGAIALMAKMAALLGRDITERIFLKTFTELCCSQSFAIRRICATNIGYFCAVVGKEKYENVLLPCYLKLCEDEVFAVRTACADVIVFVSTPCPPILRKTVLTPAFIRLLEDKNKNVRVVAYEILGPFISTFAEPTITNVSYNDYGELVFISMEGDEFTARNVSLTPYFSEVCGPSENGDGSFLDNINLDETETSHTENTSDTINIFEENLTENDVDDKDKGIKVIVETVKNAVLSYREVEHEHGVLEKRENNVFQSKNNINNVVINDSTKKIENCDNLNSDKFTNLLDNLTLNDAKITNDSNENLSKTSKLSIADCNSNLDSSKSLVSTTHINGNGNDSTTINNTIDNQVNLHNNEEDDSLLLFNSYNYWYISPEMPLDLSILDKPPSSKDTISNLVVQQNVSNHTQPPLEDVKNADNITNKSESGEKLLEPELNDELLDIQGVVPQSLIDHYISIIGSSTIDPQKSYKCAFSLPAVAATLGKQNWHLLKATAEHLATNIHYTVRRVLAVSLHELASILGTELATEYLAPIFEGFLKDLDEVRIGVLKHLAQFLRFIEPKKRNTYLPCFAEFLNVDVECNWRFREELAEQLILVMRLYDPKDVVGPMAMIADSLLNDKVAAVRQMAISLVAELIKYVSKKPSLMNQLLADLIGSFAHSTNWRRRQTFALLCTELLETQALSPGQFANELMPYFLDLSWDPISNVRLVVARTVSKYIVTNEYFERYFDDPNNQHYDVPQVVLRRLQADKDKDVSFFAHD